MDVAFLVFGVLFAGFVVLVVVMIKKAPAMIQKADDARVRKWTPYAAARGHRVLPAEGSPFARTAPVRILARAEGVDAWITLEEHQSSTTSGGGLNGTAVQHGQTTYTMCVTANAATPRPLTVRVYREHALSGLMQMLGAQDVNLGDPRFDQAFIVKSDAPHDTAAALSPALRAALLAFPKAPSFAYERGKVTLRWDGDETDDAVLDAALAVVWAGARA